MRTEAAANAPDNISVQAIPFAPAPGSGVAPVYVSLSSFGAAEVRRHGQLWFARLAFDAGADGVEVRSELLVDAARELPALADAARQAGKQLVYSCADPIWLSDGSFNAQAVARAKRDAQTLGAGVLKLSIGDFSPTAASPADFEKLGESTSARASDTDTAGTSLALVIENDQTPAAGTVDALGSFFSAAAAQGLNLGMTFDMGNWHWTGECPVQAAAALAPQVRYVHCKGVQRQPGRWVAVPLADSSAPWRSILRALPASVPWAIEYPLAGDDLPGVAHQQIAQVRSVALATARAQRV